jgi:hypothetical protein
VHAASHAPLANAVVTAMWNDARSASCTTVRPETCVICRSHIRSTTVPLGVTGISRPSFVYERASNHDSDGRHGTSIVIWRR